MDCRGARSRSAVHAQRVRCRHCEQKTAVLILLQGMNSTRTSTHSGIDPATCCDAFVLLADFYLVMLMCVSYATSIPTHTGHIDFCSTNIISEIEARVDDMMRRPILQACSLPRYTYSSSHVTDADRM